VRIEDVASPVLRAEGVGITVGQRVTVNPIIPREHCSFCRKGEFHQCADITILNNTCRPRGPDELVKVPVPQLVSLPVEVSVDHGDLIEPLAVAEHAASPSTECSEHPSLGQDRKASRQRSH